MDIDFTKNFIILNYPAGAFGGFLSHCLYRSRKIHFHFYFIDDTDIFTEVGAAHKFHPDVIHNFHTKQEINDWATKTHLEKLNYLYENFDNIENYNNDIFYLQRITAPEYTEQLKDVFDPEKIIEIKVDYSMVDILSNIIYDKIYNFYDMPDIDTNDYDLKMFLSKQSAKHYFECSNNKIGKNVINFSDFFEWEKFLLALHRIYKNLNLQFDENEVAVLYQKFEVANKKYFEMYYNLIQAKL